MPILCRVLAVFAVLALCAPSIALGQSTSTSTVAQNGGGVSPNPPVDLPGDERPDGGETPPPPPAPPPATRDDALPNTGSDPRLLFLAGAALLLFGTGLRLRTADAELY